jgi:uncharacterized protein YecE (DUF72 family)
MGRRKHSQTRIGISGWTYAPWRGVFYPKKLAQHRELEYASRMLNSIEINGSFYSLQRPSTYTGWYDATPEDFVFSLKGGRYLTHMRRLKDVKIPLANFLASGVLALKEKLGPILWQLPPNFSFDAERLETFFQLLPRNTEDAAELAKQHEPKLKGRVLTTADAKRPIRYALEVRHRSFQCDESVALLRKHNIALVVADTTGKWPYGEDMTTDFIYVRLHGDEELYASGYTDQALDHWAKRLKLWKSGKQPKDAVHWSERKPTASSARDLFVYFDNDVKVKAPFDAMALAHRIGADAQGAEVLGSEPPRSPKLSKTVLAGRVRDRK